MTEQEISIRKAICDIGQRLYVHNLVAATDGNISVRLAPNRFLCTPSGVSKGFMKPKDLLIADECGQKIAGIGKVTSEFFTHLAAYEERPDISAVVHAHPPYATALTVAGISMVAPILSELVMALGEVPTAPYSTPASREGGGAIRPFIRENDAVLMERHGGITVGSDVYDAYYKMEKVEHAAQSLFVARVFGEPRQLNEIEIRKLVDARTAYLKK